MGPGNILFSGPEFPNNFHRPSGPFLNRHFGARLDHIFDGTTDNLGNGSCLVHRGFLDFTHLRFDQLNLCSDPECLL
jgi:hypothetical protein